MTLEAYFDSEADARVREAWATLQRHGVEPLNATGQPRPHVSFFVADGAMV